MREQMRIVAAAVRDDKTGTIFSLPAPARHHNILHAMADLGIDVMRSGHPDAQGFLTSEGGFLGRIGAAACAIDAGQIDGLKFNKHELFSEDLW